MAHQQQAERRADDLGARVADAGAAQAAAEARAAALRQTMHYLKVARSADRREALVR